MGWVAFYLFLAVAFVGAIFIHGGTHVTAGDIVKAAIASGTAMGSAVRAYTRANLRAYLWQQRLRLRLAKGDIITWVFAQRLDDLGSDDALLALKAAFREELKAWNPQVISVGQRYLRFTIQRTIHLKATFVSPEESEDGLSHLLVESFPLEVSYGQASKKLDDSIVPFLTGIQQLFRPKQLAISLQAEFTKANPFFSFYVEHLKPEQVKDFNLSFRPNVSLSTDNDLVNVNKNELIISAASVEAFGRLAKAFILLSADVDNFTKE